VDKVSTNPDPTPVGISPESRAEFANDPTVHTRVLQNNTQFGSRTATAAYGAQTSPVADPFGKLVGYETGFLDSGRLLIGWIMDGTAVANAYRVQLEKGTSPIVATAITHTTQGFIGATEINTYMPGTCVIVMTHDKNRYGYILGAVPDVIDTGRRAMHPYITQASRKRVDDCHKKYIKQPDAGGIGNFNGWRPFDATHASEWGAISTTGLAITLDDFLVQLSVNEFCGVYGFYHDSLLRIAGHSFQTWTAGHEREGIMDQAEYNDYQGYNAYPWEAAGCMQPGGEVIKEYEPNSYQCPNGRPYYAHWESKNAYQQPYHRTQWFFGYLGQGQRHVLHAPPEGVDLWTYMKGDNGDEGSVYESAIQAEGVSPPPCEKGSDKDYDEMELKPCMGFHEDNVSMDGRRFIASAKGIVLAKRMLLPMPTRIRRMEDPKGDDAAKNYKAAGYTGAGPEHIITGDVGADSEHPHLQRTGGVLDLHGYLFNYVGLHPFHWHTKDYKLWQQSELEYAEYNHHIPSYSILKSKMYLPQPQPKQLQVDHRYGKQNFFESECFISLLDDGSVLIGDGYGSEIKMCAGCLTLSAPGDVWIKSGRSSQIWSGADCIIRSVDDIDMSTTNKNIRIKSEQNIMMLAGNDEKKPGGVLIESRAKSPIYQFEQCGDDVIFGGIVLRAPKSEIVGLAKNIYLRSGGGDSKTVEKGVIMLDAGRGESEIVTKSNFFYQFVGQRGQILQFFRDGAEDLTKKANSFSRDATVICGPLMCDKDFISGGNAILRKNVICADQNSHIFTGAAAKGLLFVAPCDGDCADFVEPVLDTVKEYITKILPELGDKIEKEFLYQLWYQDGRPGNGYIMDIMEFSFRTDDQYKVPDFLVMEDRWQQMARISGDIPKTWTEKKVTNVSCGETWPFPGKKWLESQGYGMVDFGIAQYAGGGIRDADRGAQGSLSGPYQNPKFKPITRQKINGLYPIVGR
jgi:hypothetical protein